MLVWFALNDALYAIRHDDWSSLVLQNVLGGVIGAGLLMVAAAQLRFLFGFDKINGSVKSYGSATATPPRP